MTSASPRHEEGEEEEEKSNCMNVSAFWSSIADWVGGMCVEQREVGVKNRYYFDESSKTWELQGGETDEDRRANLAIQTGAQGELPGERPAWRTGEPSSEEKLMAPPPTDVPACTRQFHQTPLRKTPADDFLQHPVYAPKTFAVRENLADPRPVHDLPPKPKPTVYSSPFGEVL
ncbi:hypothetical protein Pmar_PMAR000901 [Perkinsus marinus ATCC 50983]|uniref:Uncharacterized protein n=1 Tax=Perkinsus marinus (strain ATCC 50983 / TXsc) TaxID=423536 RepID=C5LK20_PERM5|nr:hypothetical protein Pmar_PMAR000901 [Perkinsus marinus ATCC 50983]EER02909.1 hypothetical protein Pmar_PMAR000901 [Perkinsus marinus ATCC 50983]|eukprot:XP_002771093.1 hypothetical protein Pmar_PMAR000901 [Perkinsus marinus ATCC 50983]